MRDSREAVLAHHVAMALRHGGLTLEDFAQAVADHYRQRTPFHARRVPFVESGRDPYIAARANAQTLGRMLGMRQGPVRLPVDVEEAIVLALPEPYQHECVRELLDRMGMLPVRAADCGAGADPLRGPAVLMRETAESILALETVLANREWKAADRPAVEHALRELTDVQAAAAGLIVRLQQVMPPHQSPTANDFEHA